MGHIRVDVGALNCGVGVATSVKMDRGWTFVSDFCNVSDICSLDVFLTEIAF